MSEHSEDFFNREKRGRGEVKHAILKSYFGAYFGCLGQTPCFDRLIYVDGFSGPGEYHNKDGTVEDGSPIVAIKTIISHMHYDKFNKPIHMYFIDKKEEHTAKLAENIVENWMINERIDPDRIKVTILNGQFEEKMGEILDLYKNIGCPMLVFADPFGLKGISMDLMRRMVERPVTELFVNVMFSTVIRWVGSPKYNKILNTFLGEDSSDWKNTVLREGENKAESFVRYYVKKLTQGQVRLFHHKFAMKDECNRNIYQLIYFSRHFDRFTDMKTAMINQSQETETFIYSEFNATKSIDNKLSGAEIREKVNGIIKVKFHNETAVSGEAIGRFVWIETPYKFNLKRELKKDLKKFVVDKNTKRPKFDEMTFDFTMHGRMN